jgi:hypothetical protein
VAVRLGNVLYWTGCGLAGLIVLLGVVLYFGVDPTSAAGRSPGLILLVAGAIAFLVWLVGRAARYIMAGT